MLPSVSLAQVPVFKVPPEESDVKFHANASVAIDGKFNKWEAMLTFPSTDATSAVLEKRYSLGTKNKTLQYDADNREEGLLNGVLN